MILEYALMWLLTPVTAIFSCIGLAFDKQHWKKYLAFLAVVIFLIAYSYTPKGEPDLVRYFNYMEACRGLSLSDSMTMFGDGLFVKNFIFWVAGNIGGYHLIPALATTLVYIVTFFITFDFAQKNQRLKYAFLVILIEFLGLQYISIVNNVRNVSAFALIALGIYLDLVKNNKKWYVWLLYVLPIFIHPAAIIGIVSRVLVFLPKKLFLVSIILVISFPAIINYLYVNGFGASLGSFIGNNINKIWWYINDPLSSTWSQVVASSLIFKIQRWTMVILSFVLFLLSMHYLNVFTEYHAFLKISALFNLCTIACYPIVTPQYWRFSTLSLLVSGVVLVLLFSETDKTLRIRGAQYLIVLLSIFLMIVQVKIGKNNVDLADYIVQIIVNNPYTVLVKTIMGIGGYDFAISN